MDGVPQHQKCLRVYEEIARDRDIAAWPVAVPGLTPDASRV
jgi:hypothetical protein